MAVRQATSTSSSKPLTLADESIGTWDTVAAGLFGTLPQTLITPKGTLSPEQEAILRQLLTSFAQEGLTTGGATPFGGKLTADTGNLEGLSLEALEQMILQRVQGTGPGAEAQTAMSRMLQTGGAPVDFEDYFQKSIRDPALQEFREIILPELTRRFGSSGAFGSDRLLAEQQATERLGKTLTGARSELSFRTQSDAQNRILQALGLAPGIETASTESLIRLMEGTAKLPEQARLTAEYGEFQRQQTQKKLRMDQILAALGVKTKENIPQSVSGSSGIFGSLMGGASRGSGGFF